ncbi:MAG: 2-hydroxychromene-2-carboxylate isomerase [Rhodobacteraceae bacterium]|nr:2-hydroxychromene-2-carboxylate isomerase [Paracoccaceae bacterium]
MTPRVEVFYSLQSDYCYFLLDRLLGLSRGGVDVAVRPVLGGVIRIPDRYRGRQALEQRYFDTDTNRTAAFLGLPYAYPDPSPIAFEPGSLWVARGEQPRNERLNRLFVGAVRAGRGLEFLDHVGRMLWDGSTPGWDRGDHLARAMAAAGLEIGAVLAGNGWESVAQALAANDHALHTAGHWGVPLMVYEREPFYGQDRFDQLLWRMKRRGAR